MNDSIYDMLPSQFGEQQPEVPSLTVVVIGDQLKILHHRMEYSCSSFSLSNCVVVSQTCKNCGRLSRKKKQ